MFVWLRSSSNKTPSTSKIPFLLGKKKLGDKSYACLFFSQIPTTNWVNIMSSVMEFKELALALWNKERHMTFEFKGRPVFSHYRDSLHLYTAYLCSGLGEKKKKTFGFLKLRCQNTVYYRQKKTMVKTNFLAVCQNSATSSGFFQMPWIYFLIGLFFLNVFYKIWNVTLFHNRVHALGWKSKCYLNGAVVA